MPRTENSKVGVFYYVYILESQKNKEWYAGYTDDLRRRLVGHNGGQNKSTKPYLPWRLIYYEACLNQNDALRRERDFKTTKGRRTLKRRLREYIYLNK